MTLVPERSTVGTRQARTVLRVSALLLIVQAVVLSVVLTVRGTPVILPVTVDLSSAVGQASGAPGRMTLSQVDIGVAVVVLCAVVAVLRMLASLPWALPRAGMPAPASSRTLRWAEFSVMSSVIVFLVAQLNGVSDVGALVGSYALTSGLALFGLLQERVGVTAGHPLLALCFGAGIGIVPWGIIAFHQVGAALVGTPPTAVVRVITLVMLAFAFAFFVVQWREARRRSVATAGARSATVGGRWPAGEWMHTGLTLVSVSVFAWLVVLAL